jgi:anti-sigma-K factor RskA
VNIQEYISSGILESYVLGLASEEERREFEQICAQYPEVLQARIAFEQALEKQAMANAITPAAGLKNKILVDIDKEGKVVSMTSAPVRKMNGWKYAAAACIALLAGSIYWIYFLTVTNVKLSKAQYQAKLNIRELMVKIGEMQNNPSIKMAGLKGELAAPSAYTTVYWDTTTYDVYLLINNLPKPADSLQYQLWALADGKPVDLGFISDEYFIKQDKLLLKAKNAQNAQAFAITLEKKGRTNVNTPEGQMYVMGKL